MLLMAARVFALAESRVLAAGQDPLPMPSLITLQARWHEARQRVIPFATNKYNNVIFAEVFEAP